MARRRKTNTHLPQGVVINHNAYYLIKDKKWIRLGKTYAEALRSLSKLHFDAETAADMNTMNNLFDRFTAEFLLDESTYQKTTRTDYLKRMKFIRMAFGEMRPADVRPMHVRQYIDARGRETPTSANREKALLSAVFRRALGWGVVDANPCRGIGRNPERPRTRYVTHEQWDIAYSLANETIQVVMDLAYITGLRKANIFGLRRADWDAELGFQSVTLVKTRKHGPEKKISIPWTPDLAAVVGRAIQMQRIPSIYLIANRDGQKYTDSSFSSMWTRFQRKVETAGVERFTLHDIRAKAGSDKETPEEAAKLLGNLVQVADRHYFRRPRAIHPNKKRK